MRATGYLPDPAGYRRTPFRHLAARLGASLPSSVSLERYAPDVLDQNQCGSCTGHATSAAIYTALNARGGALPWVPSPRGLYSLGRAIDRSPLADGALPPLLDEGAEPNQVMRGVEEWGVRPIQAPTSAGAYSDCEPSNVNDEPTLDELETDSVSMLVGEYEIFSTGTQRVTEVCIALAGGIPVCVAIAGGSDAFQGYSGGVLGPLNAALDHYVCLTKFRTNASGQIEIGGRNSWGMGWGEDGNFWLSADAVAELGALVAADFRRAP